MEERYRDNKPVVLCVDDDRGVREMLQDLIEGETGYEVMPCATIDQAVGFRDENVRLIILDHFLEGYGGTPSTEFVPRLMEVYPGVRVVCHTGSAKVKPGNGYDAVAYKPKSLGVLVTEVIDNLN